MLLNEVTDQVLLGLGPVGNGCSWISKTVFGPPSLTLWDVEIRDRGAISCMLS